MLDDMNKENAARWSVMVSSETDRALRAYLGSQGQRKGDLSKFIEEAVRWRMFDQTVQQVKARNANLDPSELQAILDEACDAVRKEHGMPAPESR